MLVDEARYEGEKSRPVSLLVTNPKKSRKVCTVYYFTINLSKPRVFMYCRAVRPSMVKCGSERNICAVLYCSAWGRSNPKLGGRL